MNAKNKDIRARNAQHNQLVRAFVEIDGWPPLRREWAFFKLTTYVYFLRFRELLAGMLAGC